MAPSLSIVIPVFNEHAAAAATVRHLARLTSASPFDDAEIVVVDDGSDPPLAEALTAIPADGVPVRVVRQENRGRFTARATGLRAARGELALLVDARNEVDPGALDFLAENWTPERAIWNGHIRTDSGGRPYGLFWDVITHAAWRDYLDAPRTTTYGPEEFDRYPKGTTQFACPRSLLLEAIDRFDPRYADLRHVNDDTLLLRDVAARQRINISPGFGGVYRARTRLGDFLGQSFHRGTVFFDGFARTGTRFSAVAIGILPASLVAVVTAIRRPRLGLAAALAVPGLAAAFAARLGRPAAEVRAFALLALPFGVVYVSGIWRGAALATSRRLRG